MAIDLNFVPNGIDICMPENVCKLNVKLRNFCGTIRKEMKRKHYPSVIVAVYAHRSKFAIVDKARKVERQYCNGIQNRINEIKIKYPKGLCKNTLGICSEQHAADDYMVKYNVPLDRLRFSLAMRPRTNELMSYCKNCKMIFKQL